MTELNPEAQLGAELIVFASGMRRILRRRAGSAGGIANLTEAQRELVRVVRRHPRINVSEAAAELQLAPNTVSTLVTTLDAAGWLRRESNPNDARSAVLVLTPDAELHVAEWRDRRLSVLNDALSDLSAADRCALETAMPVLLHLVERLREQT